MVKKFELEVIEKKIVLECGCIDKCCVLHLEFLKDFKDIYLGVYPKWKHKSHGVMINKEKAKALYDFLGECYNFNEIDKNKSKEGETLIDTSS